MANSLAFYSKTEVLFDVNQSRIIIKSHAKYKKKNKITFSRMFIKDKIYVFLSIRILVE